jgi:hypothetical protein
MRLCARIYAISFRSKILLVYFGILALARFSLSLAASFSKPPVAISLPRIPEIDAFNMCAIVVDLSFKLVPNSVGTAFGTQRSFLLSSG